MQLSFTGRTIAYDDRGQGIPLVLIHGFPLNRNIWQAQLEGLSDHARVIALDLPGFGESPAVNVTTEVSTYADDIREFLDKLGVTEPAIIAGHSMGGYVAMAYLRNYPDHVRALILTNTKATADTLEGKAGRDKNINLAKEGGAAAIAGVMLPKVIAPQLAASNPALVEQVKQIMLTATVPGIIAALGAMRDRPDSVGTLLEFSQPMLIVAGADDPLMSAADQVTMDEAARNSDLVTVPNSAHLTPMEQPAAFNHAVKEFLRDRSINA
jgi:pimeloyl-ACP methyl ester carboxylesterase